MKDSRKGPLAWFAANHVASNILMIFILVSGALSLATVVIEVFPEIDTDTVTVRVPYRGASPAEAEEGVCIRVEEAIASIEGIKRIRSSAQENLGSVTIELDERDICTGSLSRSSRAASASIVLASPQSTTSVSP